jgi:hypothetical protein
VVRAESAHLVPVLEEILRGEPAIDVVVDRRRNGPAKPPGPERRRAATVDCPFDLLLG